MCQQNKAESVQQQVTASCLTTSAPVLRTPPVHLVINPKQLEGFYRFDAFFPQFTPGVGARKTPRRGGEEMPEELGRRARLELFRYDVARMVRIAELRAHRENEIEPTRREASELLEILSQIRPKLMRLSRFNNTVDLAVRISAVLRPKAEKLMAGSIATILTQVLDPLRAPMAEGREQGSEQESYLLQWLRELDGYEPIPSLPHNRTERTVLTRHLTERAIALYKQRLCAPPPASRQQWLGEFLAALWQDLQLSVPDKVSDLAEYFGRKIEGAVGSA
jgi:hypothetical protein